MHAGDEHAIMNEYSKQVGTQADSHANDQADMSAAALTILTTTILM
jgi:hypothetical protein